MEAGSNGYDHESQDGSDATGGHTTSPSRALTHMHLHDEPGDSAMDDGGRSSGRDDENGGTIGMGLRSSSQNTPSQASGAARAPEPPRPKRQQVARACQKCASSKRKCSGTFPCDRCVRMGYADSCVEVVLKRSHAHAREEQRVGMRRGGRAGGRAAAGGQATSSTILGAAVIDAYAWPHASAEAMMHGVPSGADGRAGKRRVDTLSRNAQTPGMFYGDVGSDEDDGGSGNESETSHSAMAAQFAHARIHDDSRGTPSSSRSTKNARMAKGGDAAIVAAMDDGSVVRLRAPANARTNSAELEDAMRSNVDLLLRASGEAVTAEDKASRAALLRAEVAVPRPLDDAAHLHPIALSLPAIPELPEQLWPLWTTAINCDFVCPPPMQQLHAEWDVNDPQLASLPVWQAIFPDLADSVAFDAGRLPVPRHLACNAMGGILFNVAAEDPVLLHPERCSFLFPPHERLRVGLLRALRTVSGSYFVWHGLYVRRAMLPGEGGVPVPHYWVWRAIEHSLVSYYPNSYSIKAQLSLFERVEPFLLHLEAPDMARLTDLTARVADRIPCFLDLRSHTSGTGFPAAATPHHGQITNATLSTHHDSFNEHTSAVGQVAVGAAVEQDRAFSMERFIRVAPDAPAASASRGRLSAGSHDASLQTIAASLNGRPKSSFSLPEGETASAAPAGPHGMTDAHVIHAAMATPGVYWYPGPHPAVHAALPPSEAAAMAQMQHAAVQMHMASLMHISRSPSDPELVAAYGAPRGYAAMPLREHAYPDAAAVSASAAAAFFAARSPPPAGHVEGFGSSRLSGDFSMYGIQADGVPNLRRASSTQSGPSISMFGRTSLSEQDLVALPAASMIPGARGASADFDADHPARNDSTSSIGLALPLTTQRSSRAATDTRGLSSTSIDMP